MNPVGTVGSVLGTVVKRVGTVGTVTYRSGMEQFRSICYGPYGPYTFYNGPYNGPYSPYTITMVTRRAPKVDRTYF